MSKVNVTIILEDLEVDDTDEETVKEAIRNKLEDLIASDSLEDVTQIELDEEDEDEDELF